MAKKHKHKQLWSLRCKNCRRTLVKRMERYVAEYADALHCAAFGGAHGVQLAYVKHRK